MKKSATTPIWTSDDSADLYRVEHWGGDVFSIDDNGELVVRLTCEQHTRDFSLAQMARGLATEDVATPMLIRFPNILAARIQKLNTAFNTAIRNAGGTRPYRGLFPIKVNQQRQVVEHIATAGETLNFGFEVGTKSELAIAMAHMRQGDRFLVCNGYKDAQYVDLALQASCVGLQVILVFERPSEVELVIARSRMLGIRPRLGLRTRLTGESSGHWAATAGDQGLFGLGIYESIAAIDILKREDMLDCLEMLHYHQGSQIPDIRSIEKTAEEAALIYCGLVDEGAPMGLLNVGGGLAIDYDGSHTTSFGSRNYSFREYADTIIGTIFRHLDSKRIEHPIILSESGRAVAAQYSVLVFDVLGNGNVHEAPDPDRIIDTVPPEIVELAQLRDDLNAENLQTSLNRSTHLVQQIFDQFSDGDATLRLRALAEYHHNRLRAEIAASTAVGVNAGHGEIKLSAEVAQVYYGNFSVFQSLPDSWAIDQLFPVMPLQRLDEAPIVNATIADITCDCDGRIKRYIHPHDNPTSLRVHQLNEKETYYMGVFMVGAYQETLGDLHNLLGYPNTVAVTLTADGKIDTEVIPGDSIHQVLSYVEHDRQEITDKFRRHVRQPALKLSDSDIAAAEATYEQALDSYTYLAHNFGSTGADPIPPRPDSC